MHYCLKSSVFSVQNVNIVILKRSEFPSLHCTAYTMLFSLFGYFVLGMNLFLSERVAASQVQSFYSIICYIFDNKMLRPSIILLN